MTMDDINQKIKNMLVPVYDRLKNDQVKVTDLPVINDLDIGLINLQTDKSVTNFDVIVINARTMMVTDERYIICTRADPKLINDRKEMEKEVDFIVYHNQISYYCDSFILCIYYFRSLHTVPNRKNTTYQELVR